MTTSAKLVTTVSSEADEEDDVFRLPLPWLAIVIVCIIVAIVTAVGGNLLIILSYKRDYRLRNVHNLYLLHLAVCDLFIGAISMPCYLLYTGAFVISMPLCLIDTGEFVACRQCFQHAALVDRHKCCLLYTSPSPRDINSSRMPSSA